MRHGALPEIVRIQGEAARSVSKMVLPLVELDVFSASEELVKEVVLSEENSRILSVAVQLIQSISNFIVIVALEVFVATTAVLDSTWVVNSVILA